MKNEKPLQQSPGNAPSSADQADPVQPEADVLKDGPHDPVKVPADKSDGQNKRSDNNETIGIP